MRDDFLALYLDYNSETEVPQLFHRWAALSMVGAYLGRQATFRLGHFEIHPNLYCMLIGSPGTRKSTAIKLAKSTLSQVGYKDFSAEKTTKEKFLLDLQGEETSGHDILEQNLFGGDDSGTHELYIAADEFNDYIGNGNIEFISLLGSLWDFKGVYTNRIKNGKSVSISNPTISIFGGNTPTGFSLAFPADIIGQGFFSRLLLVYGEPTGKKITFPKKPPEAKTKELLEALIRIKGAVVGDITMDSQAEELLDYIYNRWENIDDVRFESYSNRRFTHLLKLCMLCAAFRYSTLITASDVIYANTILTHTEHLMPLALGEFGKAKDSGVSHKLLQILEGASAPMTALDIWPQLQPDLGDFTRLTDMLGNLKRADKIQFAGGGFLRKKHAPKTHDSAVVDFSLLTSEERKQHG